MQEARPYFLQHFLRRVQSGSGHGRALILGVYNVVAVGYALYLETFNEGTNGQVGQ
jgi:hypothetical protein